MILLLSKAAIVLIVILLVVLAILAILYFVGSKLQKKQEKNEELLKANRQEVNLLVLDKERVKMKDSKLPKVVIEKTPKIYRRSKVCVINAKMGSKLMSFMCDARLYEQIPVRCEIRAGISGIYIMDVKATKGQLLQQTKPKGIIASYKYNKKMKKEEAEKARLEEEKREKKRLIKQRQEENRQRVLRMKEEEKNKVEVKEKKNRPEKITRGTQKRKK